MADWSSNGRQCRQLSRYNRFIFFIFKEKKKGNNNRKNGNKYLSWAYVEAAHKMRQFCPEAQSFYERKCSRVVNAVAVKSLAAKITKAVYHILKSQKDFDLKMIFG